MDELWQRAVHDLDKGNFTALQATLGGPDGFDRQIVEWHGNGKFDGHAEMLAEALTCSCMLGLTETARYLLDKGVDPVAGMRTGLNGFHYVVSGGRLEIVKLLIGRNVTMETENMYGGNIWQQALWSAVNEHKPSHADIIDLLIEAGAKIEAGTLEWWETQPVPSEETKRLVAKALRDAEEK